MSRTWVLCVVVAIVLAMAASAARHGFDFTCVNDKCYMVASTSLIGLIASTALAAFVVFHPQNAGTPFYLEPIKIWEQVAAFAMDFLVVLAMTSPIATLPILLTEAGAVGRFQWSFERDFSRPTDAMLVFPGVLLMFVSLFVYFYVHPAAGRQTVGQYVSGFRVEGIPGSGRKPAFASNVLLGFIGACMWPVSIYLAAKRQDKAFWWNLRTSTRLVRVV